MAGMANMANMANKVTNKMSPILTVVVPILFIIAFLYGSTHHRCVNYGFLN